MNDAGENREGLAAHDWAGQAGMRWLAQLDRFEMCRAVTNQANGAPAIC